MVSLVLILTTKICGCWLRLSLSYGGSESAIRSGAPVFGPFNAQSATTVQRGVDVKSPPDVSVRFDRPVPSRSGFER